MIDTTNSFIAWGIITFVSAVLAFCTYMWLSNVSRFENRKKEIATGMVVCVLAVSSLMFLPVLFSRIDLHSFGEELINQIQFSQFDAEDTGKKLDIAPFVKPFSHFLAATPLKYVKLIVIGVPALFSLIIILFVILIIFKIREPKKIIGTEYNRKHLFEYNSEIVTNLNKKK